jgi:hypothetical protein
MPSPNDDGPQYDGPKQKFIADEFGQTGQLHFRGPNSKIEVQRYKQDCRKRALEMAHGELINLTAASQATKGGEVNVTELADKYYSWLISIPEK